MIVDRHSLLTCGFSFGSSSDLCFRFLCTAIIVIVLALFPEGLRAGDVHFHFHEEKDEDEEWDEFKSDLTLCGLLAAAVGVTSPFWGPPAVIHDDGATGYFQKYPYEDGGGFMRLEGDPTFEPWTYSLRLSTEYGYDFDSVARIGANLHLETTSRWGVDSEIHWFDEHDHRGMPIDDFLVGDVNVIFRFGQSHHAQWWTGIGMNWLDDPMSTDVGFNFTYGADIFVGKPWVLSGVLDYGSLSSDDFFHGRLSIGANWRFAESFVGYDFLNTGAREHDTVMIGLRTWW
ncbi:MAG: hypothetical protein VB878_14720 [Pirellulaceae bacterium]